MDRIGKTIVCSRVTPTEEGISYAWDLKNTLAWLLFDLIPKEILTAEQYSKVMNWEPFDLDTRLQTLLDVTKRITSFDTRIQAILKQIERIIRMNNADISAIINTDRELRNHNIRNYGDHIFEERESKNQA